MEAATGWESVKHTELAVYLEFEGLFSVWFAVTLDDLHIGSNIHNRICNF